MIDLLQHLPPWLWITLIVFGAALGTVAYLILLERKVASWVQDRLGPNRVGPKGLLQPMADGLKMFLKEDFRAGGTEKILFSLAPALMMTVVIVALAIVPWGGIKQTTRSITIPADQDPTLVATAAIPWGTTLQSLTPDTAAPGQYLVTYRWAVQIADLNIGVLFLVAVLSLGVYGVVLGGWASNNKYSFLGGLRAAAQMVSYEIPLALSLLTIVLMFGTLSLGEIVQKQTHYWGGVLPAWNVFCQPLTFLMFLLCIHAEANRSPFDLAEAEQELVGGYHTEYSSMRFALFFLGEYTGMMATSAVCVALFFGGWHIPWLDRIPAIGGYVDPASPAVTGSFGVVLLRTAAYFLKVLLLLFVFMWVRWSLPRFRFDQLMLLAWRALIPIALAMLLATGLIIWWRGGTDIRPGLLVDGRTALMLLGANVFIVLAAMLLSTVLPAPQATNRRLRLEGSRFSPPLPEA